MEKKNFCKLPVFAINLEKRKDRYTHILNEFEGKDEFHVTFIQALEHAFGGYGLSQTMQKIVRLAKDRDMVFVVICEDDHVFTADYDCNVLQQLIEYAEEHNADVLVGGASWFDYSVKINENVYWLNAFTGCQFTIVFKRFYEKLLNYAYTEHDDIDHVISRISERIFAAVPLLSIQRDFGYSDVTTRNNKDGVVSKLYVDIFNRLVALEKVYSYVNMLNNIDFTDVDFENIQIATYIINLAERVDRLTHVHAEFEGRSEFALHFVNACKRKNGALGLWNSIKKIVKKAVKAEEDVIIICEDDHVFSEAYTEEILFKAIYQGAHLGADLILGGITNTRQGIVVSPELCWVDVFQCTQFTIIYSSLFEDILTADFKDDDAADLKLSAMTANKYVIHPFISTQKDFGYSDIPIDGVSTRDYQGWFSQCGQKLNKIRSIHDEFHVKEQAR